MGDRKYYVNFSVEIHDEGTSEDDRREKRELNTLSDELERLQALQKYYERNHLFELSKKTHKQFRNTSRERNFMADLFEFLKKQRSHEL